MTYSEVTLQITYTITDQDEEALAEFYVDLKASESRLLWDYYSSYQFFLLLLAVVSCARRGIIAILLFYLGVNVFGYLIHGGCRGLNRKLGKLLAKKIIKRNKLRKSKRIELSPQGIGVEDDYFGTQSIKWQAIDSVKVTHSCVFFVIEGTPILFVPRRVFETEEKWRSFCDFAGQSRSGPARTA